MLDGLLDLAGCAPLLTPNAHEAAALAGEDDPDAAARALAERTGAPAVVTLGADGVVLADPEPRRLPAATAPARVADTRARATRSTARSRPSWRAAAGSTTRRRSRSAPPRGRSSDRARARGMPARDAPSPSAARIAPAT